MVCDPKSRGTYHYPVLIVAHGGWLRAIETPVSGVMRADFLSYLQPSFRPQTRLSATMQVRPYDKDGKHDFVQEASLCRLSSQMPFGFRSSR